MGQEKLGHKNCGGVGGCEDGAVGGDEDGGEIEWKQKNKSEYGTCDKNNLTPLFIKICPLFDEAKKGDFFTPLPTVCSNVTFWAIIFF